MSQAKQQTIVIFGATSGIAMPLAQLAARRGANFYLLARDQTKLDELKADLMARGAGEVTGLACDLGTAASAEAACQKLLSLCPAFDLAVLAHGILGTQQTLTQDVKALSELFAVNVLSPLAILNQLRGHLLRQKRGQLAVISSVAGDRGRASNYVYGSSKAALTAYTSGLRAELSHVGVHVLTVKPGMVATAMTAHLRRSPLMASADTVARDIFKALDRRALNLYTPWFWWPIMLIVRHLPERIFQRLKF